MKESTKSADVMGKIKGFGLTGAAVVFAGIIGLNCYTIVGVGEEAAISSFGEVHEGKILEGFNLVAPWWDIEPYSSQFDTQTLDNLGVASQDKFKTSMDVAYTGHFLSGNADKIRKDTGSAGRYLSTHVEKRVLSCLTKAGGNVASSQAFFSESTQTTLASNTLDCVNAYLEGIGGYKLTSIQFSDIRLDPKVKGFMVLTKQRQEQENQATSSLNIANTNAQVVVKQSEANLSAAENNKKSRMKAADAALYEVKKQAEGNLKLSKSLTPALVEYMKIKQWNGVQPRVVAGDSGMILNIK